MKIYIGNINAYTIEYLRPLVSENRWNTAMKYKFTADRKRTLLAHALLCHAVSRIAPEISQPVEPVTDEYSKPHLYLPEDAPGGKDMRSEVYFSLSHSGDFSICAVGDAPVGADIEKIRGDMSELAKVCFTKEEQQQVLAADHKTFFEIWTLKESCMKALGLGMTLPMESFSVCDPDSEHKTCRFKSVSRGDEYYDVSGMNLDAIPGYALSYALCHRMPDELGTPELIYPEL